MKGKKCAQVCAAKFGQQFFNLFLDKSIVFFFFFDKDKSIVGVREFKF